MQGILLCEIKFFFQGRRRSSIPKGTVFNVSSVENGVAMCDELDTCFFENEWEEYIPELENK